MKRECIYKSYVLGALDTSLLGRSAPSQAYTQQEVTALLTTTPASACQDSIRGPCSYSCFPSTSGPVCVSSLAMCAAVACVTFTKNTASFPSLWKEGFPRRRKKQKTPNKQKKKPTKTNQQTKTHMTSINTNNLVFNCERIGMCIYPYYVFSTRASFLLQISQEPELPQLQTSKKHPAQL